MAAAKQELPGAEHESRGSLGDPVGSVPPAEAASQPFHDQGAALPGWGQRGGLGTAGGHLVPICSQQPGLWLHGPRAVFG